ncbi:MAG: hypothetical protein ACYSUQ_02260, partial [Planctomycetota bacterium]
MAWPNKRSYWTAWSWPQDRPARRAQRRHARAEDHAAAGRTPQDPALHAQAAADWIARAQDATPDDGVAADYQVGQEAWGSSCPETTGYVIPTLLAYAPLGCHDNFTERAMRMADWLCGIQLPCGGLHSGLADTGPADAAVLSTGQAMLGWLAALRRRPNPTWQTSLQRAALWLCDAQDDDGCWRKHGSPRGTDGPVNTYNVRAAWALIAAGRLLDESRFIAAGRANLDWARGQESSPGLAEQDDSHKAAAPVLHTIAHTARGFMEGGLLLGEAAHLEVARWIAQGVAGATRADGSIPGCLTRPLRSGSGSSCLSGIAQMALVWHGLDRCDGGGEFAEVIERASCFLRRMQSLDHCDPGVRGGIAGSHPIGGDYAPHAYPAGAAKFFLDLMMEEMRPRPGRPQTASQPLA